MPQPAEQDAALRMVDRAIEAMGGAAAIERITTARYVFETRDPTSPFVRVAAHVRGPNQFAIRTQNIYDLRSYVQTSDLSWLHVASGNLITCLANATLEEQPIATLHRLAIDLRSPRVSMRRGADSSVDGRHCRTLFVTEEAHDPVVYCFDVESGLLAAIDRRRKDLDGKPRGAVFTYDKWHPYGEVLLPTVVTEKPADGSEGRDLLLSIALFNVDVDREFMVPPCIQELLSGPRKLDDTGEVVTAKPIDVGEITRERVETMTYDEVRDSLTKIARERSQARARGDGELEDRLRQEWCWLMDRLRGSSPQEARP